MEHFADCVIIIYDNMKQQVEQYCKDGSYEELIPPLQVLFDIVRNDDEHNGLTLISPEFLKLFEREVIAKVDWYHTRLIQNQMNEISTHKRTIAEIHVRNIATENVEKRLQCVQFRDFYCIAEIVLFSCASVSR